MLRRLQRSTMAPSAAAALNALRWASVTEIKMPALSPTMTSGKLAEWKVQVGEECIPSNPFAMIGTDKATLTFENVSDEGFMARHVVAEGTEDVQVGDVIALMVDDVADINCDEVKNWKPDGAAPAAPAAAAPEAAADAALASPTPATSVASGDRLAASPLARKMAREAGVALQDVTPTGGEKGHRIIAADVEAAVKNPKPKAAAPAEPKPATAVKAAPAKAPAAAAVSAAAATNASGAGFTDTPCSSMRKVIAERLTRSKNVEVPHYYLMNEIKAKNMQDIIKHLNKKGDGKYKISVNDYLIKAIARSNKLVPECNTHWHGDFMRKYDAVDVAFAVATPSGLMTPIVRNADSCGLVAISEATKALATKAREGKLLPEEYQGGTVTLSNMGSLGIPNFTAIINPPHSMILAAGGIVHKPEVVQNSEGEYEMTGKVEPTISFTASFDHRVIDGAVGAKWFQAFKDSIENPLSMLL